MKWSNNLTLAVIVAATAISLAVIVKNPTRLGLDLRGGTRLVYQAQKTKDIKDLKEATKRAREIIERRLAHSAQLGIAEPQVVTVGDRRIAVSIPEIKDPEKAKKIIGKTARLEFRYVKKNASKSEKAQEEVVLTGEYLKDARVAYDNLQNPVVAIDFRDKGAKIFADFTRNHVGETLAIYLDNNQISAPTIQEPILTGSGQITGNFTVEEAQELAALLKGGALPVPLKLIEERTVGPTLGKVAIQKSLKAGALGVAGIFLFMLLYYRIPGLVGCLALALYGFFTFALVEKIPIVLTLPGIAGLILSLGMAVDANILIYERLREELREGRTLHAALDTAFQRAWTAILDSNVTTAITCAILWRYGTGPIVGFAKTLLLGIGCSMFTALVCTRAILHAFMNAKLLARPSLYGYAPQEPFFVRKNTSFTALRRVFFILSSLVLIPSLIALLPPKNLIKSFPPETGLLKGVDFSGGTLLLLKGKTDFSLSEVRKVLKSVGLANAMVVKTKDKALLIRTKKKIEAQAFKTAAKDQVNQKELLRRLSPLLGSPKILQKDFVGPVMTKDLTHKAFYAVVFSSLLIMLYLAFRFSRIRFGISALMALIHDVGIMTGLFAIFGKVFDLEVDSLFVTATLTVLGYSVNDTVVIFDRIRENIKRRRQRSFTGIIDRSLQETFARSVNTSFTTLIPIVTMLFLGGASLKNFLLALLIGFVAGTYSSIFIASPLLLFKLTPTKKEVPTRKEKEATPLLSEDQSRSLAEPSRLSGSVAAGTSQKTKEKKKKKKKKKLQRRR